MIPSLNHRVSLLVLSLTVVTMVLRSMSELAAPRRIDVGSSQRMHGNQVTVSKETTVRRMDFGNSKWCPNSTCTNSNLCRPCRRRWLIIVATGRSASTTLLYMLGSLPGVRMAGENRGQLRVMKTALDNIRLSENFRNSTNQRTPWGHYEVPDGAYACVVQTMMETINPSWNAKDVNNDDSETIIGFKTIRFLENIPDEQVPELAEYLKESFPCARFVINIRSNTEDQVKSWEKAFPTVTDRLSEQDLDDLNRRMRNLAELLGPETAHLLDSKEWLKNLDSLNTMVTSWLGFADSCAFTELLEFNTQGDYGYNNGRMSYTHHSPDCRYLG
jgi:hypothetical protein